MIICVTLNSASWKSFDPLHFSFGINLKRLIFFVVVVVKFLYSMFCNKATFFFFSLMGPHLFSHGLPCSAIIGLRVSNNIN